MVFNCEIESKTAAQIIVSSGARGTISQVKQIMGVRGQVAWKNCIGLKPSM
ncbi:MAG: hypothetical protein ACTS45_01810 [Candidatus Hodgkinia cicadicola]